MRNKANTIRVNPLLTCVLKKIPGRYRGQTNPIPTTPWLMPGSKERPFRDPDRVDSTIRRSGAVPTGSFPASVPSRRDRCGISLDARGPDAWHRP